ncbi:MAG: hypothetical protein WCE25_06375 [Nitrososphaeraceae archaeon]
MASDIVAVPKTCPKLPYSKLEYTLEKEMIKTGYASDLRRTTPDQLTVALSITRGRPFPWLDYDEWQRVLSPQKETKDRWLSSKKTEQDWKI